MSERVEIRCPGKFRKLFFVLIQEYLPRPGMLMEVSCYDCAKQRRKEGWHDVKSVFHYYDSSGDCVQTKEIR